MNEDILSKENFHIKYRRQGEDYLHNVVYDVIINGNVLGTVTKIHHKIWNYELYDKCDENVPSLESLESTREDAVRKSFVHIIKEYEWLKNLTDKNLLPLACCPQ